MALLSGAKEPLQAALFSGKTKQRAADLSRATGMGDAEAAGAIFLDDAQVYVCVYVCVCVCVCVCLCVFVCLFVCV